MAVTKIRKIIQWTLLIRFYYQYYVLGMFMRWSR